MLKNITLGVEIRDSCWYAPIALQQTIELIRESITPYPGKKPLQKNQLEQCSNTSTPGNAAEDSPLIGIAGPASSSIALQVQNLLQLFSIPQIGYSTTSKDLSDKARFSTFMRVVPSDYYQAQVMIDIVKANNWTYIHTVHTGNKIIHLSVEQEDLIRVICRRKLRTIWHSSFPRTCRQKRDLHSARRFRKIEFNFHLKVNFQSFQFPFLPFAVS